MANESESTPAAAGGQTKATMVYGLYTKNGNFVGKTVNQARAELKNQWGIPDDAAAFKGKNKLDGAHVIEEGDRIEFVRRQGEKG